MTDEKTKTDDAGERDSAGDTNAEGSDMRTAVIVFAVVEAFVLVPFLIYLLFFR